LGILGVVLRGYIYNNRNNVWVSGVGAIIEPVLMIIEFDDF
jgi:hypothetical protein